MGALIHFISAIKDHTQKKYNSLDLKKANYLPYILHLNITSFFHIFLSLVKILYFFSKIYQLLFKFNIYTYIQISE